MTNDNQRLGGKDGFTNGKPYNKKYDPTFEGLNSEPIINDWPAGDVGFLRRHTVDKNSLKTEIITTAYQARYNKCSVK